MPARKLKGAMLLAIVQPCLMRTFQCHNTTRGLWIGKLGMRINLQPLGFKPCIGALGKSLPELVFCLQTALNDHSRGEILPRTGISACADTTMLSALIQTGDYRCRVKCDLFSQGCAAHKANAKGKCASLPHPIAPINSRPTSIRRISDVPAPISISFASRNKRLTAESFMNPAPPIACTA